MATLQYQSTRKTTFAKTRKGASKALNWPHALLPKTTTIHPTLLSSAGWYHTPTAESTDRTTCYSCKNEVEGWTEGDDAIKAHLEIANGECGFIKMLSVVWEELKDDDAWDWGVDGIDWPASPSMQLAREATFLVGWPHHGVEGIPTPQQVRSFAALLLVILLTKMRRGQIAAAGMYFKPSNLEDEEDNCACPYCLRSVASWEAGDDPMCVSLSTGCETRS